MTPNRLIHEKSPYLLQHAHNPVDWRAWSEEAFDLARKQDKPVFLSIGYATCHWCHVMEKESFEDGEMAARLNETFVCVKVDREERPDIDAVYMAACQMLTGRGGWPLTILMTPDKKPFFAATYIPKHGRFGQGGLLDICREVDRLWRSERATVLGSAENVLGHLGGAFAFEGADEALGRADLDRAYDHVRKSFDAQRGGFGPGPKFPTPHRLLFLLRYHHVTGNPEALGMAEQTLSAMRLGGIRDHVGGGFHRYATDRFWLLPHFEKMLYDQALLAMAYAEAHQAAGNPLYAETAHDIVDYVLKEMTSDAGGFFTAEDADSEGEEGRFYVWRTPEIESLLGGEDAGLTIRLFNLSPDGNFHDEATREKTGANIFHLSKPLEAHAADLGMTPESLATRWQRIRKILHTHRKTRPAPLKDDKILTDWNGLMIAALAQVGRALDRPDCIAAAENAARFIRSRLTDGSGRLLHRHRDGDAGIPGCADDYAFMIWGMIELYQAVFDPVHLEYALKWQRILDADFRDAEGGGYYLTRAEAFRDLPVRPKEIYDGALPSANSVTLHNLIRLSRLVGAPDLADAAHRLVRSFAGTVRRNPDAFTHFLSGILLGTGSSREIVLAGDPSRPETSEMRARIDRLYAPHQGVLLKSDETAGPLGVLAPFTRDLPVPKDRTAAYICSNMACRRPVFDVESLEKSIHPRSG